MNLEKLITESTFETSFNTFFVATKKMYDDYMEKRFPNNPKEELTFKKGKKYIKIMRNTSVFCFVDTTNGDVLKAASWKAPAKGARGNIYDKNNGLGRMTPQGPEYNK